MTNLRTPHARNRLVHRPKPYKATISRGLTLGYYRAKNGTGTWKAILANGAGSQQQIPIGDADAADGSEIISFDDACNKARALRGEAQGETFTEAPVTVDEALDRYAADLRARGRSPANAAAVRHHLTPDLLPQPLNQITSTRLRAWRDGIQGKAATINRVLKSARAAFSEAASHDARILANSAAWKNGLELLRNSTVARDLLLTEAQVLALVAAALGVSPEFGLYVQLHAETGSRSSQLAACTVADLQADRVMVPSSHKGNGKGVADRTPVPLNAPLAAKLHAVAVGRLPSDVLLLKADGTPWRSEDHRHLFARAARAAGIPDDRAMIYSLRHSNIARLLRRGLAIKHVADLHDTSIGQIEAHYGRYLKNAHDDIVRPYLFDTTPGANVVPLRAA